MDMNEIISGVTLTKVCSIKADKDSTESKNITLKVDFSGATVRSVFDKALAGAVIQWQNGQGRKTFNKLTANQVVAITFIAPASQPTELPEDAFTREAKAAGVDITNDDELAAYVIKRMKTAKVQ